MYELENYAVKGSGDWRPNFTKKAAVVLSTNLQGMFDASKTAAVIEGDDWE